ncbi:MAG: phosphotransferase [Burkholderiaceae bacterium]
MTTIASDSLATFCDRHGVHAPFDTAPIRAGRNSEVSCLSNQQGQWILKNYYQHSSDKRDRLGTEFGFLSFLKQVGVTSVPQPLAMDDSLHCALYSFLPGKRPNTITPDHISQAVNFISSINRFQKSSDAMVLPVAADSCFSWQDHLDLAETRIARLMKVEPASELEREAHAFVEECLLPLWSRLKNNLMQAIDSSQLTEPLATEARILSPSDFGFHNALEDAGHLSFVDFEYAGWDDPAKLMCDFICQPELPVSKTQGKQFIDELLLALPHRDTVRHRVEQLLPVHRIKWCCILLNEFRVEDRKRRLHAGLESDGLLAAQLNKAKQYFNLHLATLH